MDTSVWIDFLSYSPGRGGRELRRLIEAAEPVALTGIIVAEILQGLTREIAQIERYVALWEMVEPQEIETYQRAAALFRLARSRGVTLATVDALIATLALEHGAVLFSLDQDFARVASFTGLRLHAFR